MSASSQIQIDRYSARSVDAVTASFLDDANPHAGWKVAFGAAQSWVRFNEVDLVAAGHTQERARRRKTNRSDTVGRTKP